MDMSSLRPGQRRSIECLDKPLLICAGAGSGKTFTLTQRIAWALMDGSGSDGAFLDTIDQALIITYTNKAAGELKDRIRSTLRAEGMVEEALKVDGAWISTIHGMCSRILREHALQFGIDPEFTLATGVEQEELRRAAIEQVIEGISISDESDPLSALVREFDTDALVTCALLLLGKSDTLTTGLDDVNFGPAAPDMNEIARGLYEMCEVVMEEGTDKAKTSAGDLQAALGDLMISKAVTTEAIAEVLSNTGTLGGKVAKPLSDAVKLAKEQVKVALVAHLAEPMVVFTRKVDQVYTALLHASGMLDTSMLIRFTLESLRNHPDIAAAYTQQFKLIMVDEFQDTSQLQIDMITQIAGQNCSHLCTVGDSQQSIYRFQGADVGVYLKHKDDMQKLGAHIEKLGDNFRSHADILAFVRRVCGQDGYFSEEFLDLEARTEGKPWKEQSPRISLALTTFPRGNTKAADEAEARYIARRFANLRNAGHEPGEMVILMGSMSKAPQYAQAVREAGLPCVITGGSRFYGQKHVALCMSLLNVLANPYDSKSLLEVMASDILPVTSDDLLFLTTYKHDVTGLPTRQSLARPFLLEQYAPQTSSKLLDHALTVLRRAWKKPGEVRPAQLLFETIVESGWLARLEEDPVDGQAVAADVLKFVRLVEEAQDIEGYDLVRTAKRMEASFSASSEKLGTLSAKGLNAVRITTIHSSKGLQFPIVAVTECYQMRTSGKKIAAITQDGTTYVSLGTDGTAPKIDAHSDVALSNISDLAEYRARIIADNVELDLAEKRRLFYVAITRASAGLIMCMKHAQTKAVEYKHIEADIFNAICKGQNDFPEQDALIDYGGDEPLAFTRITVEVGDEAEDDDQAEMVIPDETRTVRIPQAYPEKLAAPNTMNRRTGFFSYSSLAQALQTSQEEGNANRTHPAEDEPDKRPVSAPDADKATDFGTALHNACEWLAAQKVIPPSAESLDIATRFARKWKIKDIERLWTAFKCWMDSDVCARALAYQTHEPELPFCLSVGNGVLEGEIDLFCTNNDGHAFIVDYKTGGSASEAEEDLHAKHELQAMCYALAALNDGFDHVDLSFVRVEQSSPRQKDEPQTVEYSFDASDADSLKQQVEELLSQSGLPL